MRLGSPVLATTLSGPAATALPRKRRSAALRSASADPRFAAGSARWWASACGGGGLNAKELRLLSRTHVVIADDGITVAISGDSPRTVVIRRDV